jgi:hypothetical protein
VGLLSYIATSAAGMAGAAWGSWVIYKGVMLARAAWTGRVPADLDGPGFDPGDDDDHGGAGPETPA